MQQIRKTPTYPPCAGQGSLSRGAQRHADPLSVHHHFNLHAAELVETFSSLYLVLHDFLPAQISRAPPRRAAPGRDQRQISKHKHRHFTEFGASLVAQATACPSGPQPPVHKCICLSFLEFPLISMLGEFAFSSVEVPVVPVPNSPTLSA